MFLQSGYQLDALQSGLTTLPFPLCVLIASFITGRLGGAFGVAIISQIFFSHLARMAVDGAPGHQAFKTSFETAMLYNIACYVLVGLMALLLKTPPTGHPAAAPVVTE